MTLRGKYERVPIIKEALILINAMHTIFINDDESGLHHDYKACLKTLAPYDSLSHYPHNNAGEDNAYAHIKR